ncbi:MULTISPECIES: MFS transporter [Streptomyces]|uniref:MFS transporter n=1 Tax=Streptomyces lycopersici TaxID=2974589 RepID=UPI0021CE4F0F|nr:MFS transporter [Streptomyces sp. NEAU-383]
MAPPVPVPSHRIFRPSILALTALLAAFEGYDLACYGATVPSLLADPRLGATKGSVGTVGSLVPIGMLLGAALSAALVRRIGSRRLLISGATLFSAGMLVCAAMPTFTLFGVARLVVGIGLGMVLPTVNAYVADISEPARRGRNIGMMNSGYAAGALMAPLLATALLPEASWRWIYVIGALPAAVVIPLSVRLLPESPTTPGMASPLPSSPRPGSDLLGLRVLLGPGVRSVTLLFWMVAFCGLLLVFGISAWLPTIMRTAGYSLGSSLLQTAAMWTGAGVGMVVGGRAADRLGIKPVVGVAFLTGAACLILMPLRPGLAFLFPLMFISGMGLIGSQALTNTFVVTRYPEALRGQAIGWTLAVGRLGAISGPTIGGWVLSSDLTVEWNFYLFAIPGVLGAALAALVPLARADRSPAQDAITCERPTETGFV